MPFDRFWRDPWGLTTRRPFSEGADWGPRVNVTETEEDVTVEAESPVIDPKDVDVQMSGGVLMIRGQQEEEREDVHKSYHYTERRFGRFERTFRLPHSVNPDQILATFKNGLLKITTSKQLEAKPKRIEVGSG